MIFSLNEKIKSVNNQYSFNQCNQYSLINECFNSDVCAKEITKEEAVNAYELWLQAKWEEGKQTLTTSFPGKTTS